MRISWPNLESGLPDARTVASGLLLGQYISTSEVGLFRHSLLYLRRRQGYFSLHRLAIFSSFRINLTWLSGYGQGVPIRIIRLAFHPLLRPLINRYLSIATVSTFSGYVQVFPFPAASRSAGLRLAKDGIYIGIVSDLLPGKYWIWDSPGLGGYGADRDRFESQRQRNWSNDGRKCEGRRQF